MTSSTKNDYKKHIDGLRALSVISVIIFHLDHDFLPGGFIGVDIFFVISGYLISKIITSKIEKNEFNISIFFLSRARRILPMLFFILIFFFPLIFFLLPSKMISISESILTGLFFVSNIIFYWQSGYFGEAINLKPFIHLWSLSVEEQFYIVFPIYCILFYKKKFFLLSLISFFIISFILANSFGAQYPNANFFLTPTRIWEILSGVFFMFFEKKKISINSKILDLACSAALVIIISSFILLNNLDNIPNIKLLPTIISTGVLIIYGANSNVVQKILCNKPVVFIGLISYSLYMLHQPILAFNKNLILFEENILFKIIFFIVLVFISSLTWKFIEQPSRNYKKISTKKFLIVVSLIGTVILISNIVILKTDGFVSKYKEEDRYLALLNPIVQGRYVSKKFNTLINKKFKNLSEQNVIIMGDSYAQDFINMAYENNYFKGFNVKTAPFHAECYLKFLNNNKTTNSEKLKKCTDEIPSDLINAKSIFFINIWEPWILNSLNDILSNPIFLNKKVFIIGTKNFGEINIRKLLKLSIDDRLNYEFKLSDKAVNLEKEIKSLLRSKSYISSFEIYCNQKFNCKIFTNNNEIISYDGGHLTKQGAKFFGQKLFENDNLRMYKNY
jgi:peptidoglycan/LPS O-acetylase OafA/YrhL